MRRRIAPGGGVRGGTGTGPAGGPALRRPGVAGSVPAPHVLFLGPETGVYNLRFVDALKRAGARVSGIGHAPLARVAPELRRLLDRYVQARSLLDEGALATIAREIGAAARIDRVETIDEPAIVPAARVREALGVPGLTTAQAVLCRDKAAMKEAWRAAGIPCAASAAASDREGAFAFAEREGFPLVVKPVAGFGTLDTFRVETADDLARALDRLRPSPARRIVVEEFVDGHEGFYDTITAGGRVVHRFVGHYHPTCLEALSSREIRPRIGCTNRVASPSYAELHAAAERVVAALGLTDTATHMEWFFGKKGLRISEIGARPAGERIWDLHAAGNEFDLYLAWAEAVLRGRATGTPSRRFATGSVQIRPARDGRYAGHVGLAEVARVLGDAVIECEVPRPGSPTQPLDRGWHANTWFRLRDPDYDRLLARLEWVGRTVRIRVR